MPDVPELKARVTLETVEAQMQAQALAQTVTSENDKAFAKALDDARRLAAMSIEENEKQIEAEKKMLESLHLKFSDTYSGAREELAMTMAVRKTAHEETIKGIQKEDEEQLRQFKAAVARREELRGMAAADEQMQLQQRTQLEEVDTTLAAIHLKRADVYKRYVNEVTNFQKERLETISEMYKRQPEGGDSASLGSVFKEAKEGLKEGAGALQSATGPLLRILGVGGIAFSLEAVVSNLYKANEELRQIRLNYADIASYIGESMFSTAANNITGEAMKVQRELTLRTAGAIPETLYPTVVGTLTRGGFRQEEEEIDIARLAERNVIRGMGTGIQANTIAQMEVEMHQRFGMTAMQSEKQVAAIIQDAQALHIPFEDLSKWTMALQDRMRLWGYDVDDSRRIIKEFGHEIALGKISVSDLAASLENTARMNWGQGVALTAFPEQIRAVMGEQFAADLQRLGGGAEQGGFLQTLAQGALPDTVRKGLSGDERAVVGKYFDMGTGKVTAEGERARGLIDDTMLKIADVMTGGTGGAFVKDELSQQLLRQMGLNLSETNVTRNDQMKAIKGLLDGVGSDATKLREAMENQLKKGEEKIDAAKSPGGIIKTAITDFWRETSSDIALTFSKLVSGAEGDVRAEQRTRTGLLAIQQFSQLSGVDPFATGQEVSAADLETTIKLMSQSPSSFDSSAVSTVIKLLQKQERISADAATKLMKMLPTTTSTAVDAVEPGLISGMPSGVSYPLPTDVNLPKPGVQVFLQGVEITVNTVEGMIDFEDLGKQLSEAFRDELGRGGVVHP